MLPHVSTQARSILIKETKKWSPVDRLTRPMPAGADGALTAAQLGNQVTMQARRAVADYYDGWLHSDDELAPLRTRNLCLRCQVRSQAVSSCGLEPRSS